GQRRSVNDVEGQVVHAMLKADEMSEKWGVHVRIDVARVEAVGEVKNREHAADVALFQPADERKMKVLANLCIQGKEGGKALAVGRPNVILERVKVGVGEPGMNIENGEIGRAHV